MFFQERPLSRNVFFATCLLVLPIGGLQAENETVDGAEYQDIETVEVTAAAVGNHQLRGTVVALPHHQIEFLRPTSLADIFDLVPSANVRINSRGETLVSLRGAGERQLAVFFDGAPVNVPWDNRFDLRLVPALAIGSVTVSTGPTTSGFGANTAGGVVDIASRSSMDNELLLEGGRGGLWSAEARTGFVSGNFRSFIAMGHLESNGVDAPDAAYTGGTGGLITNTDRRQTNVLVRTTGEGDNSKGGVSVLYSNAAYGIAPEQGLRVDPGSARFWRFPGTEHLLVSGNYQTALSDTISLQGTGWHQSFDQRINSFEDGTYSTIEDIQQDRNSAYGARLQLGFEGEMQQLSVAATSQWASHKQQEFEPQATVRQLDDFSQFSASLGADYRWQFNSSTGLSLGASYDVLDPGETAGRGRGAKFDGVNASMELRMVVSEQWVFRVAAARRVRLPTLRELFGEAIGRFVVNPGLAPEVSWLFEAAAGFQTASGSFNITPFWIETRRTLDQTRVVVDGQSLRERVNLAGSRTYGVEMRAQWHLGDQLSFTGDATWSRSRARPESVAISVRRLYLSDRPNWLAQAAAKYQVGAQTTFGLSVVYRGTAKSENDAGLFLDLSAATQVNMLLSHKINLARSGFDMELFARLDNLTDTFVEPQLGLPSAGRSFKLGLKAVF